MLNSQELFLEGATMGGAKRAGRIVGLAGLFFVITLAIEIALGAITGAPINVPQRAFFWAIVAPFWSLAMEWIRTQTSQPARGGQAHEA
jgi:hypothetical protein